MSEGIVRRLTTIVAADVAGYSRLIREDEEGTLQALREHRKVLFDPLIQRHGGRIANTAGDSLLLEFSSALEAVRCALAVQDGMAKRNAGVPEERQIVLRIGINVGDVVAEGDDLLGDGVNVAARLEALADPGSILLSRTVRDQVRDLLRHELEDLGDVQVKNIERPVRVFRVLQDAETAGAGRKKPKTSSNALIPIISVAGALLLAIVGFGVWWSQQSNTAPGVSTKSNAQPFDKPSIAVLPFANFSNDEAQEYFADGMTDDLITDLSKLTGLIVIARNSVFAYKGKNVKVQEVAKDLNVSHVLEGSVRRSGDQMRINAQLIDAKNGAHLWSERFDGAVEDVFKLQDQVTQRIVEALRVRLSEHEKNRNLVIVKVNPKAYELYRQAITLRATFRASDEPKLLALLSHAVKLDSDFASAHAQLGEVAWQTARADRFWVMPQRKALALSESHIAKALSLEPNNALALSTLAHRALEEGETAKSHELITRAVAAAPNDINVVARQGYIFSRSGRSEEAVATVELALRLEPNPTAAQLIQFANVYLHARQYDKAVAYGEKARQLGIRAVWALETLVAAYARLGDKDKLVPAMADLYAAWPTVNLRFYRSRFQYFRPQQTLDHWLEGLRLAGIPEWPTGIVPTAETLLSPSQVTSIFAPNVQLIGTGGKGDVYRMVNTEDGTFETTWRNARGQEYRFTSSHIRFVLSEDGKQVRERCFTDPDHDMGRERCGLILRNLAGSKAGRDEYLFVSDRSVLRFAVFSRDQTIDWTKPPG